MFIIICWLAFAVRRIVDEIVWLVMRRAIPDDNEDADKEDNDPCDENNHLVVAKSSTGADVDCIGQNGDTGDHQSGEHECHTQHTLGLRGCLLHSCSSENGD